MTTRTQDQDHFVHLVRLAWDLRRLGLAVAVELPLGDEPFVLVRRTSGPVRVRASLSGKRWTFTWGRGRDQSVDALDAEAAEKIWRATR